MTTVILLGATVSSDAFASAGRGGAVDTTSRHVVFRISSPLVTESSSLAVSTTHPGLVYTTNDSGDTATVYVLDDSTGELVGRTTLTGVSAVDVEALGIGADGTLVVGDIGDNHAGRSTVVLYKLPQPGKGLSAVRADAVSLTYSDGPRDAESLLYDVQTGRAFVASKRLGGAKVYRSRRDVFATTRAVLRPQVRAPAIATDAAFIRGQHFVVIRTYFSAVVFRYPSWQRLSSFDLPFQPQGESLAAPAGGRTVWIGSEGARSKVLRVTLPTLDPRAGGPSARVGPSTTTRIESVTVVSSRSQRLRSIAWVVLVTAALALLLLVGGAVVLRRRRGSP